MIELIRYLVDTPLLVRLANSRDVLHNVAFRAVITLHLADVELFLTPQNLIEFRNVATRPISNNGLGYSISQTEQMALEFEALFTLLDDNTTIFNTWKALVHDANVIGKQVHDARLAACCQAYAINGVITFNRQHFDRFIPFIANWTVIDPHSI